MHNRNCLGARLRVLNKELLFYFIFYFRNKPVRGCQVLCLEEETEKENINRPEYFVSDFAVLRD